MIATVPATASVDSANSSELGQEPKRDVGKAFSLAQREGAPFSEVEESIS